MLGKEIKCWIFSCWYWLFSLIFSGVEDDIFWLVVEEGKIWFVGGIIVVKGFWGGERKVLGEVLKVFVS